MCLYQLSDLLSPKLCPDMLQAMCWAQTRLTKVCQWQDLRFEESQLWPHWLKLSGFSPKWHSALLTVEVNFQPLASLYPILSSEQAFDFSQIQIKAIYLHEFFSWVFTVHLFSIRALFLEYFVKSLLITTQILDLDYLAPLEAWLNISIDG